MNHLFFFLKRYIHIAKGKKRIFEGQTSNRLGRRRGLFGRKSSSTAASEPGDKDHGEMEHAFIEQLPPGFDSWKSAPK